MLILSTIVYSETRVIDVISAAAAVVSMNGFCFSFLADTNDNNNNNNIVVQVKFYDVPETSRTAGMVIVLGLSNVTNYNITLYPYHIISDNTFYVIMVAAWW